MYRFAVIPSIATALILVLGASSALASQSDASGASEQWVESIEKIESSGAGQRDSAVGAGQELANSIDERLQSMERWVADNWDKLSDEAREDRREIISDLRQQRNDLAEWFGAMKHSSADSWDEAKQGFVNVYNTMSEKFKAAVDKFDAGE